MTILVYPLERFEFIVKPLIKSSRALHVMMWEACTLESAKEATIASEEFSLYATHEIVYRVPSTYSIN